jgi:hypothetical protein
MNDLPSNWFSRTLSKLNRKIVPQDASSRYQKRLDREWSRVRKASADSDRIVLTFTHGKVGFTTMHKAIRQLPGYQSFQNHFMSEQGIAAARRQHPGV